jgi:hypothetical protein
MTAATTSPSQTQDPSTGRRVPLVTDAPLDDPALDRFGFAEFAHALTLIVDDDGTSTPLTIAVSAPWGGGKSSLGCMVQTMLEQRVRNRAGDDPRLVCWFNAWEHDDAPHLGAALAASVARTADRHRHWWRRALAPLPNAMLQPGERSRQTIVIAIISAIAGLLVAMWAPHSLTDSIFGSDERAASGAGVLGIVFFGLFVSRRMFTTAREAARFLDDPRSAAARGTMTDVKRQFGRLIGHATHRGRLVIIVADLERCSSDRALEVCQVASQLLAQPGVVTILLADMEPIARSAGVRYAASMPSEQQVDPEEIGRRYLAKIVQLEIALPPPDPEDMRRVIRDYGPSLRHARPAPATEPRRRLRRPSAKRSELARVVQALRWWPLGVWFASGVAYGIVNPAWLDESENTTSAADWVWGLLFFVALALSLASRSLRGRARKQRDALREQIEELKVQGASPEQIKQDVAGQAASDRAATPSLISDLVSSSFLDSEEFREVETFISENPPTLPREAKRSFNHAQLLTEIARARHMFGGTPELTPAHLAKWLVLREQWPALGRSIVVDPERLAALEGSARDGDISPEAWELLSRGPRLSEVIVRLVYFQPAGNGRPPA